MDEMRLESKFTTGLVSKIARTVVRKKLGYDMDIRLNRLRTTVVDEKTHVHLDVDLELTKEELDKLLKSIGLSGRGPKPGAFVFLPQIPQVLLWRGIQRATKRGW